MTHQTHLAVRQPVLTECVPKQGSAYRFTGERRRAYLGALSDGAGRVAAARAIGVNRSTISRYVVAHPAFGEKVRDAEHAADDAVANVVYVKALTGDVKAAALWLAARQPDQWAPTRTVRHGLADGARRERAEPAPLSPLEQVACTVKLEQTGVKPPGSAAALEQYFVTIGALPAPSPPVLELVDVTDAEVVEDRVDTA